MNKTIKRSTKYVITNLIQEVGSGLDGGRLLDLNGIVHLLCGLEYFVPVDGVAEDRVLHPALVVALEVGREFGSCGQNGPEIELIGIKSKGTNESELSTGS